MMQKIKEFLDSIGYITRFNYRRTHLQFKVCPNCGNSRWNFELEVAEKFVFNCWACSYHGATAAFLKRLGYKEIVPGPHNSASYKIQTSEFIQDYLRYHSGVNRLKSEFGTFKESPQLKIIDKKPFYFSNCQIHKGVLLLGQFRNGYLAVDFEKRQSRFSAADMYLYIPENSKTDTLVFVEGFFDIFPFFKHHQTNVLSGTSINKKVLQQSAEVFNQYKKIYVCLDQGAEKKLKDQLKSMSLTDTDIYIMKPYKHSPAESECLSVVEKL